AGGEYGTVAARRKTRHRPGVPALVAGRAEGRRPDVYARCGWHFGRPFCHLPEELPPCAIRRTRTTAGAAAPGRGAARRASLPATGGRPEGARAPTGDQPAAGNRGPEPYPDWLVTELAAVDSELGI